jgi:hypothetical protein
MFSLEDKRHDILRFTKQISVTRISNLPSKFHVLFIFERKGTLTGGGGKMVEWGGGHHGGWGGGFGPPSYIVKKCPEEIAWTYIHSRPIGVRA